MIKETNWLLLSASRPSSGVKRTVFLLGIDYPWLTVAFSASNVSGPTSQPETCYPGWPMRAPFFLGGGAWQWYWRIERVFILQRFPALGPCMARAPVDLPYRMWAEPGWEWSHGWSYFFKDDCKNVSHHMLLYDMPPMKQRGLRSLLLNMENRSSTVWPQRHWGKRQIRFTWFSWDACSWNPAKQPQGKDPC